MTYEEYCKKINKPFNPAKNNNEEIKTYDDKEITIKEVKETLQRDLNIIEKNEFKLDNKILGYNYENIAKEIITSDINPHINLYAAYYNFNENKIKNMDKLLTQISYLSNEETYFKSILCFDDYLFKLGIPSKEDYNQIMQYLISLFINPSKNAEYEMTIAKLSSYPNKN